MKVLFSTALVLAAGLSVAAGTARAQMQGPTGLLPLPPTTSMGVTTASYNQMGASSIEPYYNSMFSNPNPTPGASAQNQTMSPSIINEKTGTTDFQQAVAAGWEGCGSCCPDCCCGSGGGWFGAVGGLIMGRDNPNGFWTSYETNNNYNQLMNTGNAGVNWQGGWQFTGGYAFCGPCGVGPAIGFTYWGVAPMIGNSSLFSATNELSTPINLLTETGEVMFGANPSSLFFDSAREHRIRREDRVNNFEVNLYTPYTSWGDVQVIGLVGFRYFRFTEFLQFGSTPTSFDIPEESAYMNFNTYNNLYGAQFGFYANWMVSQRLGVFVGPKVGLFANQMSGRVLVETGDGVVAENPDPNNNVAYNLRSYANEFSMLAEFDTGVTYFFRPNLFAYVGYRLVGISNIALADNQFLTYLADTDGFEQLKSNGSLILHGAMFGAGFMF